MWLIIPFNGLGNDNISHFGSQDPGIVADILPQGKKSQLMEFRFFLQGERADMSSAPDLLIRIFAKSPKCFQCTLPSSVWIDVRSILHSFEPCSVLSLAALDIHELILANLLRIHWTGNWALTVCGTQKHARSAHQRKKHQTRWMFFPQLEGHHCIYCWDLRMSPCVKAG